MGQIIEHESGLDAIEIGGEKYVLACLPTDSKIRMAFRSYQELDLPRMAVEPISRRDFLGEMFLLNQKSNGSCVGFATAGAMMDCRALAGYTPQRLSGAFIYSYINGGRNNGASIGDALTAAQRYGTCLETEAGWDAIYPNRIPAAARETAQRFLLEEGYRIDSFSDALDAISKGFTIVYAVMVGGTFDRLDSEDVVGLDRGPGNHAVRANGIYISQKWGPCLDSRNSWGQWGNNGWFRTSQRHFEGVQQDAFAIRSVKFDPMDPKQLPTAK